jgi:predicted O-methyltransferase YrrM
VAIEHRSSDWTEYKMVYDDPHRQVEPAEREIATVDDVLATLRGQGIIDAVGYDHERFLAHRAAVAEQFEIPWTAITPRMQRLLYALNAIRKPAVMVAAGVFCGNTFFSNAGAGAGPGACYEAKELLGIEIKPDEAERAERNVRRIDPTGVARIIAADAVDVARDHPGPIDLLYLDADGDAARGKGIYLEILQACYDRLSPGALVLAHNSINCAERLCHYLAWVRDPANMKASANVMIDGEGLEVSAR